MTTANVKALLAAAERGDAQAAYALFENFHYGESPDYALSAKYLKLSAELGHAVAQSDIGMMLLQSAQSETGEARRKTLKEGIDWLRKSVEQEYAPAQCNLGGALECGNGVDVDLPAAINCYRRSAEQGNAGACLNLGGCLQDAGNFKEAFEWYKNGAELSGETQPCFLANSLTSSLSADTDEGIRHCQYKLAECYQRGCGVKPSEELAVSWWLKAAEPPRDRKGHMDSQAKLGAYYGSNGADANAFKWYSFAAEQGHPASLFNVGCYYDVGNTGAGVEKNDVTATIFFFVAADKGHALAQHNLANYYWRNNRMSDAFFWFRKSAEQGCDLGQYRLGFCYWEGKGVERNPALSVEWVTKAAKQGYKAAITDLNQLKAAMNKTSPA
jgi:TPR repeat protein